jgi:hypothetical protein
MDFFFSDIFIYFKKEEGLGDENKSTDIRPICLSVAKPIAKNWLGSMCPVDANSTYNFESWPQKYQGLSFFEKSGKKPKEER